MLALYGLLWLLLAAPSIAGPLDEVETGLFGKQQAFFDDLVSEMRPFTNESSGSLVSHLTTTMAVLKEGMLTSSDIRGKQLFRGLTPACLSCQVLANIFIRYVRAVPNIQPFTNRLIGICRLLLFSQSSVCEGLIDDERPALEYAIRHSSVTPVQLCELVFSSSSIPSNLHCGLQFHGDHWTVYLPPSRPSRESKQLSMNKLPASGVMPALLPGSRGQAKRLGQQSDFNGGRPYLKMLHLTDLHYDPYYVAGSNAECAAPKCCTKASGPAPNSAAAAGKWGDYRYCDSPERLVVNMLDHIRSNHPDIDYVVYTGDSVAHDLWELSRERSSFIMNRVSEFFSEYFPNTPVYGALGNHEVAPRDSFPPPEDPEVEKKFSNVWLYNLAADNWERLLPNVNISREARITGSYSALVEPGLRIISLNTNFCNKMNWWVMYKNKDPGNVLRWLVQELQKAEARGEFVQIIAHIAPLYRDCYEQWRHQFSRVVTRFSKTIRGQFYGHSHILEALINYDVDNPNRPIGVQYLTPSNTPHHRYNPSYTLFYIDGNHPESTRAVLDTETFFMNLTAANSHDDVRWLRLYSAKKDLNLDSLEAPDWERFVRRMDKDPELTRKFYQIQVSASDVLKDDCDSDCRELIICAMMDSDKLLPRKCKNG